MHIPSSKEVVLLEAICSILPSISGIYLVLAACTRALYVSEEKQTLSRSAARWRFSVGCLVAAVFLSYLADAIISSFSVPPGSRSPAAERRLYFTWASSLLWGVNCLVYRDLVAPFSYPFYGTWAISLGTEISILLLTLRIQLPRTTSEVLLETLRLALLVTLVTTALGLQFVPSKPVTQDEERAPLLGTQPAPLLESQSTRAEYGSCDNNTEAETNSTARKNHQSDEEEEEQEDKDDDEKEKEKKTFRDIFRFLKAILPFFWPSGKPRYHLLYVGIAGSLILQRAVNVITPLQLGLITNILVKADGTIPWKEISVFILLRLLNSSSGLPTLVTVLWMPLEDLSYHKISTTAFNHIMSLSCDFHDSKSSSKVLQTVMRGQYVKDVVNRLFFVAIPTLVDLGLAITILYYFFDSYMALTTIAVAVMYVWISNKTVSRQTTNQKTWVKERVKEFSVLSEATEHWKTVSYFNRVSHERNRYELAVAGQLKSRFGFRLWNRLESALQSFVLLMGLFIACLFAAYAVSSGSKPIGSFMVMFSYWGQLTLPLSLLADGIEMIIEDLVEAEDLLELLEKKPTVIDAADAKPLVLEDGCLQFKGVQFSYDDRRVVLKDINFVAPPGRVTAIVGKTGGGKSTILKLLCRFYDPVAGVVSIDGQDVSKVTLESLREVLGIVPQDPILFRDSILANIRYARLDATDEDVIEACKAAALHDKIMSFTKGYDTVVGERGVKLSGGELQRVAIARAMVKDPKIVLLDEATSSVDSETEAHIQSSLKTLCAGRTTIVIAHRLSTIMNADQILVVNDGEIVERGTHSELLDLKGYYHRLCSWQGFASGEAHPDSQIINHDIILPRTTSEYNSSDEVANITAPSVGSCTVTPDQMHLAIDQNDLCEHCRQTFANSSGLEDPKPVAQTGGVLKPEAPEFIPRALQNYNPGSSNIYLQTGTNTITFSQPYTPNRPPSDCTSDTGESVEIHTGHEEGRNPTTEGVPDGLTELPCNPSYQLSGKEVTMNGHLAKGEPLADNEQNNILSRGDVLSTSENDRKNIIIRRKLSRSEPVAPIAGPSDRCENSRSASGDSHGSDHEAPATEVLTSTSNRASSKTRRRRRRNNWRRRKDMRTGASTQSGTDCLRSSSEQ